MLNLGEVIEVIHEYPKTLQQVSTNKSGHLHFRCDEIKKIVFKINPNRRTFYIRKPGTCNVFLNMGCMSTKSELTGLIQNAINLNSLNKENSNGQK